MKFFVMLILMINVQAEASKAPAHVIQVKSYNSITSTKIVRLSEIVDLTDVKDLEMLEQLSKVVLGDAPALGEKRIYSNKAIAEAIRKHVTNKKWNIKIPHRVIVENRGHEISREIVEAQLLAKWKASCDHDCEIKITNIQLPAVPTELAKQIWHLEHDGRLPRGAVQARLHFQHEDGRPVYYWVSGQAQIRRKVPVLTRAVPQGARIQQEDMNWEWRDVTYATDTAANQSDIVGQQSRFVMQSGDVIWKNSIIREKAVRRGEVVRVYSSESAWEVAVQAITEQDGYVGDTVNLRNPSTNKSITGRVVAAGEVEIR